MLTLNLDKKTKARNSVSTHHYKIIINGLLVLPSLISLGACQTKPGPISSPQGEVLSKDLATLKEHCQSFNLDTTRVVLVAGRWQIVSDKQGLIDFGNRKDEAQEALKVIQHYGLNQACRFNESSPVFHYFLASGEAPSSQEECLSFRPNHLTVQQQSSQWTVGENKATRIHLAQEAEEAKNVQAILVKHQFTQKCTIGGSHPSFQYFRR